MKNQVFILVLLLSALLGSCTKDNNIANSNEKENSFINSALRAAGVDPELIIKFKPYRKIERNKKGKLCDCGDCFGICEIEVSVGVSMAIAPNGSDGVTLYILEDLSHAEEEFGIDEDIEFPVAYLAGSNFNHLKLLTGEYSYISTTETVVVNGVNYTSYGYVDVDADWD